MRNKLIALFLPLVITAKAFSAPAGSACDWVDQEALAALGLANAVSKASPIGPSVQVSSCAIATPDTPQPSLIVIAQSSSVDHVIKPVCNWGPPISLSIQIGTCFMDVGYTSVTFNLMVAPSSTSAMQSTLSAQVERLFNKHLDAAAK